jgi:uncharacterized membrane protein
VSTRRKKGSKGVSQRTQAPVQNSNQSSSKITATTIQQRIASWSGPVPSPDALENFERVVPGSAERIISSAIAQQEHVRTLEVKQSDHRRKMEAQYLTGSEKRANTGMWTAYSLAVFGIIAGIIIAKTTNNGQAGAVTVGFVFAGGTLIYFLGARPAKK